MQKIIRSQQSQFSIPKGVTYLNCAYMSPMLKSVEKAGIRGLQLKRNPAKISARDFFSGGELIREAFAKVIHGEPSRVVIVPSVSYGIANVTRNISLSAGENIVLADEQFPSNYYPWHKLASASGATLRAVSPPTVLNGRAEQWNQRLLEAIDSKTRVVALSQVHWADGTLFDLIEIRKRSSAVGALLIIDGTQSVGAMTFDVNVIQPDALICAGYKWLLGPYSFGMAYYGKYFDNGVPAEESWMNRLDSEDFQKLVNYQNEYQPGALRYEVGEHSNFALLPMMLEALNRINQWKPENIQAYCRKITEGPVRQLRDAGFWVEEDARRGHHLFGIPIPSHLSLDSLKQRLAKGRITVSFRGNAIRVSPHLYNSEADLLKLVKLIKS